MCLLHMLNILQLKTDVCLLSRFIEFSFPFFLLSSCLRVRLCAVRCCSSPAAPFCVCRCSCCCCRCAIAPTSRRLPALSEPGPLFHALHRIALIASVRCAIADETMERLGQLDSHASPLCDSATLHCSGQQVGTERRPANGCCCTS